MISPVATASANSPNREYSDTSDEMTEMSLDSRPDLFQTSAFSSVGEGYYHGLADKRSAKKKARIRREQTFSSARTSELEDPKKARTGREQTFSSATTTLLEDPSKARIRREELQNSSRTSKSLLEDSKKARIGRRQTFSSATKTQLEDPKKARIGREQTFSSATKTQLEDPSKARIGHGDIQTSRRTSKSLLEDSIYRSSSLTGGDKEDNGSLFPVSDHQGQIYHAFIEVCDKVFTGIPRQTIKSRMRNLGLTLVQCCGDIQDSVRRARPDLANLRVISLISKRDVNILQAYHESRMQNERQLSRKCISVGDSAFSKVERGFSRETRCNSSAQSFDSAINQISPVATTSNFSIDHILQTGETATNSSSIHEATHRAESSSEDECNNADLKSMEEESSIFESSDESNGEDCLQQDDSEITPMLKKRKLNLSAFQGVIASVHEMKAFYLAEFNHKRRSPRMAESTWQKHVERLVTFLAHCVTNLNLKPALSLVDDLAVVEGFVNHLKENRRVQNSTASRYLHSLIITAKFIHADESRRDYEQVESVCDLRSLRNQLEKAQRLTKSAPSVKLLWPQFQEVVRSLHCKYEETSGVVRARLHMNFTMLLLFAVNPGRAKELRTLRLSTEGLEEQEIRKLVKSFPEGDNAIIFSSEGPVWLIEHGYKTASKYGPNAVRFDTAEYQFVTFHLKEYKGVSRPRLLSEDKHDYFFVNKRGTQFKSASSFSHYLSHVFQEHLGFPCAINEMRHALVEHFRSSPESSDVRLAESLARVCKHSLRTQINIYDRRTESERRSQALSYLNRSAVNFILDEPPCSPTDGSEREAEDLPSPGEMCALVPSDSSQRDPTVFLAKVLKYTADGKSARLAWFKEVETRPTYYEFQAGTDVWEENTSSLIYPVDVVFHRLDGTYELRTPKERLCSMVKK